MYRLGWFSTGRGEGSLRLLQAAVTSIKAGQLPAQLAFVFCNREQGEGEGSDRYLNAVEGYRIPLISFSSRRFRRERHEEQNWRDSYFAEASQKVMKYPFEIGVLAGFMLIVSERMCSQFPMINLHPAAPGGPKGTWEDVIWELIERGETESGCYIHLVTPELDAGPVVSYCKFNITGEKLKVFWDDVKGHSLTKLKATLGEELPLFKAIRREGLMRETPLLIETLKVLSTGQIVIRGDRPQDSAGVRLNSYDLTEKIEARIKQSS